VFISGEDMEKEEAEVKKKEIEDFEKKVVVANKHFFVNSLVKPSHQIDKHKSIRSDQIKKVGLRLGTKRLREIQAREILATKGVSEVPVSCFAKEEYVMNENVVKPLKTKIDTNFTPMNMLTGKKEERDFVRYTKQNVGTKEATSRKVFIQPVVGGEKTGPKWGA
jgi:hypothetical protein